MRKSSGGLRVASVAIAAAVALSATPVSAASKLEAVCATLLGKGAGKVGKTVLNELAKCRDADISGKAVGACPNVESSAKIQKILDAVAGSAAGKCKSVCSVSTAVSCIEDAQCPPNIINGNYTKQFCNAGAKLQPFDYNRIGFPGPYCEDVLAGRPLEPEDLGQCAGETAVVAAAKLIDAIYGSVDNASMLSADAQACLRAINKPAHKIATTVTKGVTKCRGLILKEKRTGDPLNCQTSDAKLVAKIAKVEAKLDASMDAGCQAGLSELDLCGNGVGQTTLEDAKACIKAAAREVADSPLAPVLRTYSTVSLIDAAFPPLSQCGDNKIDPVPNASLLIGEECDGTDDAACPGECLPPGDLFQCTCGDKARIRLFASAALTDADAGWTGDSHNQGVADLSGYVTELSNCDCDEFDGPTCIGNTADSVCDVSGFQQPACSWEPFSGTRCDLRGNVDGKDENKDCFVCNVFSANPGTFCDNENDCDAQCYDADNAVTGPCEVQADCAAGEVCRGGCDRTQTCSIIPNGAPLPVSSNGAAVCAVQRFRTDVTGTRDIVTGEHEFTWSLYSIIHLGERNARPCPVCGGFCEGGPRDLQVCEGRCSTTSTTPCRFDVDCPMGETCSPVTPDCPGTGATCQLELVCGTESTNAAFVNKPCTIEYAHSLFGTMSNDCLPNPSQNITGDGFEIDYLPATSYTVSLPPAVPCTASGFELYDCPCPDDGGLKTKPNSCAPACNAAGPNFGLGCATGQGTGLGTTCAGGTNVGKICDEDSDCPSSTCSANPQHCTGDPSFEQFPCSTNGDCGLGTCGDACPGGRCVPLCVPKLSDPADGTCAAGPPVASCDGEFGFQGCNLSDALQGTCSATCSISATACVTQADCPVGETCSGPCSLATKCEAGDDGVIGTSDDNPGYGACITRERNCYVDPITAEGGSTLNGEGDPENDNTVGVWCYAATTNPGVNAGAGFGGPGRIRQRGTNMTNGFAAIP